MKIKLIAFIHMVTFTSSVFAQTNKPAQGAWGLGYQVNLDSQGASQNFTFSRMLNDGWEAGTGIGFHYTHSHNESADTAYVAANSGTIPVISTNIGTSSFFNFSLSPFVVKHCNITSNLDFYFGPVLPFSFGTSMASSNSNEMTGENYFSSGETTIKSPPTNSAGLGLILGSRFFFYPNLAIGAQYSLSGIYSFQSGKYTIATNYTNSGSDNPSDGLNSNYETSTEIKNATTSIGTSSNFGLNLTFYFD